MAQNITLLGASYSDVPSILLPKTGGGTAQFDDTTIASNAASASDILAGKLAYVNGSLITGTGTGGGGSAGTITQDGNGYLVVSDQAGGGGGGLEYEEGTWTPTEDIARPTISFTEQHAEPPLFYTMIDVGSGNTDNNTNYSIIFGNWYSAFGQANYSNQYGAVRYQYGGISTGSQSLSAIIGGTNACIDYWATSSAIYPSSNSSTRYWRAGHSYKWIAVWKPTT